MYATSTVTPFKELLPKLELELVEPLVPNAPIEVLVFPLRDVDEEPPVEPPELNDIEL